MGQPGNTDQTGNLQTALANAAKLLGARPALAEEQANEILKVVPGNPEAVLLLARARRLQGNDKGAREVLERLTHIHPNFPEAYYELGELLSTLGESRLADNAYARAIKASVHNPKLIEAASALCENKLAVAERLLRDFLKSRPSDAAAIRMLAEIGARLGRYEEAELLLARALELAPNFTPARHNYAMVLHRQMKAEQALAQVDLLLKDDPKNPSTRALRAAILVRIGEYHQAIAAYEVLLAEYPTMPKGWMSYGHALKTVGRSEESIAAYRKSIALLPSLGEAWWSMANLKTFRFTPEDVGAMRAALARTDLADEDRQHLDFALGKALEDIGAFEESFTHYACGNALRRQSVEHDEEEAAEFVRRSKSLFTREFFEARAAAGSQAPDPIFVVGLPRSGSTLIEQILASHSQIEGTMELPDIMALARKLSPKGQRGDPTAYLDALPALDGAALRVLGEDYIRRTRIQRKLGRAFFIDKMPNNFHHIGFIHLILPRAKIVDARRHPLGCCLSNFKQHYAHGQVFTYELGEIGRYYRDYVELMAHYGAVLPGRVHRVFHENMVEDPEREIRALLAYCGLPFEEACLNFHQTDRAVRTASSEQVRRPIFSEGVEQWRNYEPWLGPLKDALGPVLEAYPETPLPSP
jgi:tetratricopeptide (TPR) repeat protein